MVEASEAGSIPAVSRGAGYIGTTMVPDVQPWSRGVTFARATAVVMVVVLHGAIPYALAELPSLKWHVREPAARVFDVLFWACYACATPLFSALAGFLAAGSVDRHGPGPWARERIRRLGVPLVAGTLLVMPLTYLVWLRAWTLRGLAKPDHLLLGNFAPGLERALWGLGHLWYLEYVLVLSLGFALLRRAGTAGEATRGRTPPAAVVGAGALLTALILMLEPGVMLDFRNSFVPDLAKLAYHGVFFGVGASLWAHRDAWERVRAWAWAAVPAAGLCLWLLIARIDAGRGGREPWLGVAGAAYVWSALAGIAGLGTLLRHGRVTGLISRASFTTYILHLPVLAAVQLALMGAGLSPWLKLGAGVGVTLGVCLALHAALSRGRQGWVLGARDG
ncbi:MAG: acyltransferase [Leptolyngbya sp. PLA1]|nr:acyltransferase [Leptolyngbya sp. PLA1]